MLSDIVYGLIDIAILCMLEVMIILSTILEKIICTVIDCMLL